ncbi:MAG: DUF2115 family protein [Oscillospiraceae bacterium]|nr:DUF2115 family protein [Oscillospiraceae bacterium]
MTENELRENLRARITPAEAVALKSGGADLCISVFNREVCLRLLDAESTHGGTVPDEKIGTLEEDLKNYLAEYMADRPEGHKWIITACLYLTFVEHLPMHPRESAKWIEKDGKYYCPSMVPESVICSCCMCERAD